jgi:hypothetical protein
MQNRGAACFLIADAGDEGTKCAHVASYDGACDARLRAMPLYHFDLVNWKAIVDAGGADLAVDIAAMNSADMIARRLLDRLPQLKNRHYAVLVTNEDGDEVCRLPLDVVH